MLATASDLQAVSQHAANSGRDNGEVSEKRLFAHNLGMLVLVLVIVGPWHGDRSFTKFPSGLDLT
jgi:hypothetical protein